MKRSILLGLALTTAGAAGCRRSAEAHGPAPTAPEPAVAATADGDETCAIGGSPSSCAPVEELDLMDGRTPVPLQPTMALHQKQNMMDHLAALQEIVQALSEDDFHAVAQASSRIESSPQMQRMCRHMGAGAPGFTEQALEFHRRADAIGEAARAQDAKGVLKATAHTLTSCTGCHSAFRQEVVDAATWRARTGSDHAPAH